jgi:hypothetical protein
VPLRRIGERPEAQSAAALRRPVQLAQRRVDQHQQAQPPRVAERELGGGTAAEAVADDHGRPPRDRRQHRSEALRLGHPVVALFGIVPGPAERRQVDRDHPPASAGEVAGHVLPETAPGGGAVDQHHRRPVRRPAQAHRDPAVGRCDHQGTRRRRRAVLAKRRGEPEAGEDDKQQEKQRRRRLARGSNRPHAPSLGARLSSPASRVQQVGRPALCGKPDRHPGLDPGSTFFSTVYEKEDGRRIKSGMTKK